MNNLSSFTVVCLAFFVPFELQHLTFLLLRSQSIFIVEDRSHGFEPAMCEKSWKRERGGGVRMCLHVKNVQVCNGVRGSIVLVKEWQHSTTKP